MPYWLEGLISFLAFALAIYARGTYLELKQTQEQVKKLTQKNRSLTAELINVCKENAELKGEPIPRYSGKQDFLSADDPMDAILSEVGKVSRW